MKTFITTSVLGCCLLMGLSAQAQNPLSLGLKAGVTLSTTSVDEYEMAIGFGTGIVVDYSFTENLFVRSGLDFTMKGSKLDYYSERKIGGNLQRSREYNRTRLNYFQVPVMLGYKRVVSPDVTIYISGGIYGAYGVYGKGKSKYISNIPINTETYTEYDSFSDMGLKKFDFGLVGGIGAEYQKYSVNVGYEYGLTNIAKNVPQSDPAYALSRGDSWHNMNATCTLGYKF